MPGSPPQHSLQPREEERGAQPGLLWSSEKEEEEEEEKQQERVGLSLDGDLRSCGELDRKWILWHEFMVDHAHLDAWLRLAEQAVGSINPAHITSATAREELRRVERLRAEAGSRLVQLDALTLRNRTLTRLFGGAVRMRLLAAARESGRRWDDVTARLETISAQLQRIVSEWEEFEAEREELGLWLADLDVRLNEVDHLTGSTCEKLRRLQSFQQCVCVNSGRLNLLLGRGEALMQRSHPVDAQRLERRLLELLRRCSLVYSNITRTHTRLLSMRLVFEDDWLLSQASDSGCPSESLLEDEVNLDVPAASTRLREPPSPLLLPPPPPSPSTPSHEHLGLEWDPSVDVGRSVSQDDADSSYFSACTGLWRRRWSFLSSQSDLSVEDQLVDESELDEWFDSAHMGPQVGGAQWRHTQRMVSTPSCEGHEPVSFDSRRVRAWLGVQSPAPSERSTSCSRGVQTEKVQAAEEEEERSFRGLSTPDLHHCDDIAPSPPSLSPDLSASSDWTRPEAGHSGQVFSESTEDELQTEEEPSLREEDQRASAASVLHLLLAAALVLLLYAVWFYVEPPCHRGGRLHRSLHLMLRYVNGPPPT